MQVSAISPSQRRNLFIQYANSFMNFKSNPIDDEDVIDPEIEKVKKAGKVMGIETLTIFPKQVIDGKTVITA